MKIKVDLTGQEIVESPISFYDGKTIFFDSVNILPSTVTFKVWGVGIMPEFDWSAHLDLEKEPGLKATIAQTPGSETTIQGFGILTFKDVVAGKISIFPYDNKEFLKNSKGEHVRI